ncbi:addiction module protein [Pelagicoccus sp. NFK12]|uniref:Addiction module protein n=1 Tax=Pelagicoccus enzymogenes TaxID=2773457 RepID=A0A927IIL5_9BACT|nr:addiction module protein [Pelagicoccus enzymogenes]MBD5780959.1 addiction module protein [Pelagicoccus enzymogenes]MDQ8201179.1 addiction module protein [Pelagicoccus enzymogenes]
MSRMETLKTEAMGLSDSERAALASELLYSLPATLSDEDEGVSEALRRDADLSSNPSSGISWNELKKELGRE